MIALLQRVRRASVVVGQDVIGEINTGLLVFLGVEKNDTDQQARRLAERILSYRVFPDSEEKMNLSVVDIHGGLLIVPQFTLAADTRKGTRPSFSSAADPQTGRQLYEHFVDLVKQQHNIVETGQFGADMQVSLLNNGPVTFWMQV